MTLKDMFSKKYTSNCWCNNCSSHQEVQIPKGVSITQFIESATGKCNNCGCNTLVADYNQIDEFKDQPKPQVKILRVGRRQDTEPIQRAPVPPQRPSNRPANSLPPTRPRPQPLPVEEPNFLPKGIIKDEIDFWENKNTKQSTQPQRRRQNEDY